MDWSHCIQHWQYHQRKHYNAMPRVYFRGSMIYPQKIFRISFFRRTQLLREVPPAPRKPHQVREWMLPSCYPTKQTKGGNSNQNKMDNLQEMKIFEELTNELPIMLYNTLNSIPSTWECVSKLRTELRDRNFDHMRYLFFSNHKQCTSIQIMHHFIWKWI